ncbi:signal protein [Rhodococcus sp. HNM0563]|uniref:MHYT domain-containing protein n=1 Tax=unclassified Rhodococcus (in: high G+C Gram-positive bacteria) TaxID=192944 RepID=UPI001469D7E9|nr:MULTISPECIES: MHYT domain-containing protein [unclassified Rhodococcus (in: high G+C Gram-positive bacteria)]MCK0090579.1 signal protein [Rhodococcus sp. F64268]NLU61773.1 signal protein [Rhodococcus sp. HNM0563]
MPHEQHFTMGLWVPYLAFVTAAVGCYVGLCCVQQSRKHLTSTAGVGWLVMAALSIGGVGIWLMHFIGMSGFSVPTSPVRYDLGATLFSVVLAVGATLFGLLISNARLSAAQRLSRSASITLGGAVMGTAIVLMHYTGMAAIRIRGTIEHDPKMVAVSAAVGILGSAAAMWMFESPGKLHVRVASTLLLACGVVALHYTGMVGMSAQVDLEAQAPEGMTVLSLLFPAFVIGIVLLAVPIVALLVSTESDHDLDDGGQLNNLSRVGKPGTETDE